MFADRLESSNEPAHTPFPGNRPKLVFFWRFAPDTAPGVCSIL